jgi:hypothetical protein
MSLATILGAQRQPTVSVLGAEVPVSGISVAGLAVLMARFKHVSDYLSGRPVDLDVETLLSLGPEVVAAIIACGTGGVRLTPQGASIDPAEEAAAASLPLEAQVDLLEAILSRTFPRGVPDFFDRIARLAQAAGLVTVAVPETTDSTSST